MNENDFFYLFDASKNVIDHAEKNEHKAREAIQALGRVVNAFDLKTQKIKGQIEHDLKNTIESSANEIVNIISKEFKDADQLAEKAATRYEKALSWANWRLVGIAILVHFISVLGIFFYLKITTPTYSEVQSLKVREHELKTNIERLHQLGGKIQIENCDGNPCVKIDKKQVQYGDGYYIFADS